MILFQIKVLAGNIKETMLTRYFIKVTARLSVASLSYFSQCTCYLNNNYTNFVKSLKTSLKITLNLKTEQTKKRTDKRQKREKHRKTKNLFFKRIGRKCRLVKIHIEQNNDKA